jgi:hypothetical protein
MVWDKGGSKKLGLKTFFLVRGFCVPSLVVRSFACICPHICHRICGRDTPAYYIPNADS